MAKRVFSLSFGTVASMLPVLVIVAVVVFAIFFFGQRFRLFGRDITLAPTSLANEQAGVPRDVSLYTLLPKDGIRSIDDPQFVSAAEAAGEMVDGEFIIGVDIDGDERAYPINVLSRHEIVNDTVGGRPLVITYCPLCFTGIVYDRRVAGVDGNDSVVLEFGVSGKLVMNDLVMYDRQSNSLWQQILGEGIDGRYKGTRLTPVAATQTTWAQWRDAHPATLVLDKRGGYGSDSYASYYRSGDSGVLGSFGSNDALPAKAFVLGLVLDDEPKAYPFVELFSQTIVNDRLGGRDLLIVYDDRSGTATAFDRRVSGRPLTFELVALTSGDIELRDLETGSVWAGLSGTATSGPLAGAELEQLPSFYAFWFAWSDFYLNTALYQAEDA
ncbi:MAG: DUF3179 domain-containing protein [Chloroflexi bacterium]|nr:DUF3179 domain-containing protein [Chloroflexota bacterium]